MKVRLLPSVCGRAVSEHQYLTTFVINETIAIDAGALGFSTSFVEQRRIRYLFVSHSHIDHIASLPVFLENVYTPDDECVTVYGSDAVLRALREDLFNDRVWPDFVQLSKECSPFLKLEPLQERQTVEVHGVRVTPVAVDHIVPTFGFLVEEAGKAVVIASDTGPTQEIWDVARRAPHLKGVFLDASFPDALADLARSSKHLTPSLFAAEVKKLPAGPQVLAVHIKAPYRSQVVKELESLQIPRLEVATPGKDYDF